MLLALDACTTPAPVAVAAPPSNTQAAATGATPTPAPAQKIAPVLDPKLPPGTTVYNIRQFGATGDGSTIDSDAINRAIDAAAANGGGTVYFPAGYYLCYSIHLKTNITLYLDQGSWIVAAETPAVVTALQPRGGRGGFGGGGGAGGRGAGARGTAPGGGPGAPTPRLRGGPAVVTAVPAAAPTASPAQPPGPSQSQTEQDFLAKVPPGTKMYDLIEKNIWSGLPMWNRPTEAASAYQDFGHCFWHNSLIWGDGLSNVSIIGPGTIYGRGLSRSDGPTNLGGGNKSISLVNCRNVTLKDFTVWQGGWFCLLATGVDNFTISNIKVDTNRDGFDIDCCQNVHISDCTVNSPQDDGIVLKSTYALGYSRPTQNVTITNCQVSGFQTGTLLDGTYKPFGGNVDGGGSGTGRIKFGTESNGGFKNITISNCVFTHCRGLALESVDGGNIEDVTINNITMRDIVNSPIYIRLGRRLRGPQDTTTIGVIRRVNISDITVYNAVNTSSIIIAGTVDHPIEDLTLSDIRIDYEGKGASDWAQYDPPEDEAQDYPEPSRLGTMPAYGLFARHVSGLTLRNVNVSYAAPDLRPAVVLDDVQGIEFDHFKGQIEAGVPEFMLYNTRNFDVERSPGIADQHIDKMDEGVVAK
jgi:polygalacturonase